LRRRNPERLRLASACALREGKRAKEEARKTKTGGAVTHG
jgi:hypothetical protein